MNHFNQMPAGVVRGSVEALLDTFFNVQYNEHVKVWKWRKFCKEVYGVVL